MDQFYGPYLECNIPSLNIHSLEKKKAWFGTKLG